MSIYSADREIIEAAVSWLEQGFRTALVTVVKTWGSSPRPVGSLMVIREDGVCRGSVSGGCVEQDLMLRHQQGQIGGGFPTLIDYGSNSEESTRLGLPCGGRLELLIEQQDSSHPLQALLDIIKTSELVTRRVCLTTGEVSLHLATVEDDVSYSDTDFSKTFGPRWQMLLIGACHVSEYVARIAIMMNYRIVICDPRVTEMEESAFDGCKIVNSMPDDAVRTYADHVRSIVLALSHDPKLDDLALTEALLSPAFYVGAIGSEKTCANRRDCLKSMGVSPTQLERLHAPVGLAIGSHTPPEIAVSIMAEITKLRHQAKQDTLQAAGIA